MFSLDKNILDVDKFEKLHNYHVLITLYCSYFLLLEIFIILRRYNYYLKIKYKLKYKIFYDGSNFDLKS